MWFCNNQSVKEAKGKAGGNPSRPEQTMGRAQHGKTEYKYSYKYKYKYKQWAELNTAKRNTNTLTLVDKIYKCTDKQKSKCYFYKGYRDRQNYMNTLLRKSR